MEVYFWNKRRAFCACIYPPCDLTSEAQAWLPALFRSWNRGARRTCSFAIKMAVDPSIRAITLLFLSPLDDVSVRAVRASAVT